MSAPKKVLLITTNFPPNPSVGTKRVSKILKYVDQNAYRFHVLTLKEIYYNVDLGKQTGNQHKIPESVVVYRTDKSDFTSLFTYLKQSFSSLLRKNSKKARGNKKKATQSKSTVQPANKKPSILHGILDRIRAFVFFFFEFPDKYIGWLPHALIEGKRIIDAEKIDIIMATAPPHSVFIIAMILKKLTQRKLVLDFRDPWAISRWDSGNPLRYWMERSFERLCIRSADLIFFVTQKMRDEYVALYKNENSDKFKLFFNGYDPEDFPEQIPQPPRPENAPMRFVHLGTLYKRRNPEPLLKAIKALRDEGKLEPSQAQFLFIGSVVTELKFIYGKVKELDVGDFVQFLPPVSFEESIRTMFEADVLLLIQPDTDLQIPAKLFEYIYTRKPILAIAEPESATHQVLRQGNLGILAPSKDIEAIKKAVMNLVANKVRLEPDADYIRQFDYQYYITEFEKSLAKL